MLSVLLNMLFVTPEQQQLFCSTWQLGEQHEQTADTEGGLRTENRLLIFPTYLLPDGFQ